MAVRSSVKINTNQLNRALKAVELRVERVAVPVIEEMMDKTITEVNTQFQNAVYDGSTEDIEVYANKLGPRTWQLVAEGEAVGFIEYGAGVGRDAGYINPTTGKPWWVFTAKGRNIKLNAGGKELKKRGYWRTTEEVYTYKYYANIGIGGQRVSFDPESVDAKRRFNKEKMTYSLGAMIADPKTQRVFFRGKEVPVSKRRVPLGTRRNLHREEGKTPRSGAYITSGNPPNFIMRNASEKMTEELYKRFKAKFK